MLAMLTDDFSSTRMQERDTVQKDVASGAKHEHMIRSAGMLMAGFLGNSLPPRAGSNSQSAFTVSPLITLRGHVCLGKPPIVCTAVG